MYLAVDLTEFLQYAPRRAVRIFYDDEYPEPFPYYNQRSDYIARTELQKELMLDDDSVHMINYKFTTGMLNETIHLRKLPENLQAQLVLTTWTRMFLMNRNAEAKQLIPEMEKYFPTVNQHLQRMNRISDSDPLFRYLGAVILLKLPGSRHYMRSGPPRRVSAQWLDGLRDNWWCSSIYEYSDQHSKSNRLIKLNFDLPIVLQFASERSDTFSITEYLNQIPHGINYLGPIVIEFAKTFPKEPIVPEALHGLVRGTRYGGCVDKSSSQYSREAFLILHRKYPKSRWTEETPYHF